MRKGYDEYGEPLKRTRSSGSNAVPILIGCGAVGFLGLVVACGGGWYFLNTRETTATVAEKYRPQFAEQRTKLKRIAESLPASGSVQGDTLPANLDPKPVYDVPKKTFNTAILMAAHCDNPDWEPKPPTDFNMAFHEDEYNTHLRWTGDRSPLVESARRSPAKDLAQRFERSLALQYLVVARPVRYDPPRLVNDKAFIGGELDLEVFLVDLRSEKVLGAFRRSFRPDPQVMVTFTKDRKENESAEAFLASNVWSKTRAEVVATLRRTTGGTFVTDRIK